MIGLPKRVADRPTAGRTRHRYVPRPSRKRRPRYRHSRGSTSRGLMVDASKTLRPPLKNSTRYLVALGTRGQTNVRVVGRAVWRGLPAAGGGVVAPRTGGGVELRGRDVFGCAASFASSTSLFPAESLFSVRVVAASTVRASAPSEREPRGTKAKAAIPPITASPVTVALTSVRRHDRAAAAACGGSNGASGCGSSCGTERGIKRSRSVPATKSRSRTEGGRCGPICSSRVRGARMVSTTSRRSRARRAASGSTSASSGLIGSGGRSRNLVFRSSLIEQQYRQYRGVAREASTRLRDRIVAPALDSGAARPTSVRSIR